MEFSELTSERDIEDFIGEKWNSARDRFMRDANSRAALMKISETLDEIKSELPDCAVLTKKLTKSAGYVRDASNVIRRPHGYGRCDA